MGQATGWSTPGLDTFRPGFTRTIQGWAEVARRPFQIYVDFVMDLTNGASAGKKTFFTQRLTSIYEGLPDVAIGGMDQASVPF